MGGPLQDKTALVLDRAAASPNAVTQAARAAGARAVVAGRDDQKLEDPRPRRHSYHRIDVRQTIRHLGVRCGDCVIADSTSPLGLYESAFAPRWYVPRADVNETALTPVEGQTLCPYKGLCSYYDIADAKGAVRSYQDAWPEVRRTSGLVSFEPDKVSVHLDGTRLRLEPGQNVIPHGVDRYLDVDESLAQRR